MSSGIIIDLETTGLRPATDKIIEIGILEFTWNVEMTPAITGAYSGLEDPGVALSDDVRRVTGLTEGLLRGRSIDWGLVRSMIERSSLAVAHNAQFDWQFLARRSELSPLHTPFACSERHIDWTAKKFRSRALNYLAADHGFVNPFPHRALFDCATTFKLIAPYFSELLETSQQPVTRVDAVRSPFDKKDVLKGRGYRWDGDRKVWCREMPSTQVSEERSFLAREIYGNELNPHEEHTMQMFTLKGDGGAMGAPVTDGRGLEC